MTQISDFLQKCRTFFPIALLAICAVGCNNFPIPPNSDDFSGVTLTGVQHIGPDFNIAEFYVDGYYGSNVGREGGGGHHVCCVILPNKWRPGLSVEVRWSVGNWGKLDRTKTALGDYSSLTFERYKAQVPVEQYQSAERMYVHFFSEGRIRVVSSSSGPRSSLHPIVGNDPGAVETATAGVHVDALFSESELAKMSAERRRSGQ
ncbi:MAG: DUF3304 domain-containing protein [Pseudomonadota bacterium]